MNYKRVLFVCTGNVGRSRMARAIFERMVSKDPDLSSAGISVESAGTSYPPEQRAIGVHEQRCMEIANHMMLQEGLDISSHSPKHIDGDLVDWADIILVMDNKNEHYVKSHFPGSAQKVRLLTNFAGKEGEVPDPGGGECTTELMHECANLLQSLLGTMIEKMK